MDILKNFNAKHLNSGIESVIESLSDSFQYFTKTYTNFGSRRSRVPSKAEREEQFRRRAATYEEYYFKNHSRRRNIAAEKKIVVSRKNSIAKSLGTVIDNSNRESSDLAAFRSQYRTLKSGRPISSSASSCSQNSSEQLVKISSYGQNYLTRANQSTSSYNDYDLEDICNVEDDVFVDLNAATKDSICDHELNDNEIQVTISHEQKRNLLTVSLHRATPVLKDSGKLFAKVSVQPSKTLKQKGRRIIVQDSKHWEEDFVFKKLTIGQLESCTVNIKIYQKQGMLKSATEQYVAKVALKDVDLKDFQTTTLKLQEPTSCS